MILEFKVYAFHACMEKHKFRTRTNMRMQPDRAEFECLQDCGSTTCEAIRSIIMVRNITGKLVLFFHVNMKKAKVCLRIVEAGICSSGDRATVSGAVCRGFESLQVCD